ncbi:MAG: hypothetical protein HYU70_09195 [Bacteroidetes bacterium]|nr:hypothetical protein [Bacteroidota bacterium]
MKIKALQLVFFCLINNMLLAQFVNYNWAGNVFSASAGQAKRYTIGRVYYNDTHWGNYGNLKIQISSSYYKSGYIEYLIQANPGLPDNNPNLFCTTSSGYTSVLAKIELGDQTSAGTAQYYGANNYYRDIYLDADYYSQWYLKAEVSSTLFQYDKYSLSSASEYGLVTLFTSPAVQDITSFYGSHHKSVTIPTSDASLFIMSKVGIGTSSPMADLDIRGTDAGITVKGDSRGKLNLMTANQRGWQIEVSDANGNQLAGDLGFTESGVTGGRMVIKKGGNVGIGTTSPSEKFSVNGNISANGDIIAKRIRITQTGWSDYVFDQDYKLRSLSSLEAFIKENKHLPEVPSANEVEEKGISVGDNQALLLKKIEEMTLYIIQLKKDEQQLLKRIVKLENKQSGKKE